MSNRLPHDADADGPWTTLWVAKCSPQGNYLFLENVHGREDRRKVGVGIFSSSFLAFSLSLSLHLFGLRVACSQAFTGWSPTVQRIESWEKARTIKIQSRTPSFIFQHTGIEDTLCARHYTQRDRQETKSPPVTKNIFQWKRFWWLKGSGSDLYNIIFQKFEPMGR